MEESNNEGSTRRKHYLLIFVAVSQYWIVSILLTFVNKSLLGGRTNDEESSTIITLEAPMFITWFQCLVTVILSLVTHFTAKVLDPSSELFQTSSLLSFTTIVEVLPLSVMFVAMMAFNNLTLKHLGIAFYNVGRCLVHVFNAILSWVILGDKSSVKALFCFAIIFVGFLLGVYEERLTGSLSIFGVLYGILSSLFVSLTGIFTKKSLSMVQQSVFALSYYNNLNACALFPPLMLLTGELKIIATYTGYHSVRFWAMMVTGGAFGFAIGYVSGMQIKVTTPLTHNISGTAKACAQTVIATQWYGESKSLSWWLSNWIVLIGSAAYARVRQSEMEQWR